MPVYLIDNPYRVVYFPIASDGIELSVTLSHTNLAIFHGLCAVFADNQTYLNLAKPGITKLLATRHDRLAPQNLQKALQRSVAIARLAFSLGAILICVLHNTVIGDPRSWRGHVQGALSCLPNPHKISMQPESDLRIVLEQFLCLSVFGDIGTTYDLNTLIARLPDTISYMDSTMVLPSSRCILS